MIGLIIVTHGGVSHELKKAVSMIVGEVPNCRTLSLNPGDSTEKLREMIYRDAAELDEGEGVLIMTDLMGGTPANLSLTASAGRNIRVLTGVNLPMVIQFVDDRNSKDLDELAAVCEDTGAKGIINISELLLRRA